MSPVDESPTVQGGRWFCNACPYSSPSKDQAVEHAIEKRDLDSFNHMLYERILQGGPAIRRIAVYDSGLVQVEKRPVRKTKK